MLGFFILFVIIPLFVAIIVLYLSNYETIQLIKYAENSLNRKLTDWEKQLIRLERWPYINELRRCYKEKIPFKPTSKPLDEWVKEFNKKSKEKDNGI